MKAYLTQWLLFAVGISFAACSPYSKTIAKDAQGNDLRKEVVNRVALPPGCPMLPWSIPPEKGSFNMAYDEPSTNFDGSPLSDLAYTTIYVISSDGKTTAIRVLANDSHGGTHVVVRNIPVRGRETKVCVTATDTHRNESLK